MEGHELIKVMSDEALLKLKSDNDGNESISRLVDGILEGRVREVAQAKAMAGFETGITKLFAKLPHPEDIHNVYVRWGEVDIPDGDGEEIQVTGPDGSVTTEVRQPTRKEFQ